MALTSHTRAALLAVLLVAVPFAGCVGGSDRPEPGANLDPTANESEFDTTTPDGRDISAFDETNRTEKGSGGMSHDHDYWAGRSRIDILSDEYWFIPFPLLPPGAPPGTAIADLQPAPPNLVFEGTSQLEIVVKDIRITPLDPGPHPLAHFRLKYLTPLDAPGGFHEGGKLEPGKPLVIDVKPHEADTPHAVASQWLFRVFTEEPASVYFNITITAVRGHNVVAWPPHPDLYAEKNERVVFDKDTETRAFGTTQFLITGDDASWNRPERVITYGSKKLLIEVEVKSIEAPMTPVKLFLDYHNASEQPRIASFDPTMNRIDDPNGNLKTYRFEIPVTDFAMDSPYAPESRWGFRMLAEFADVPDPLHLGLQGCMGCFPYTIKYHLRITAFGESHSTVE
ncbi:MAG TPA: hypothetical protein VM889_12000 [Candidatus Thermoplasmatota archaeon]|nr:hypothetical protein [Candidatus Thermoplasmatota archaeon]